LDSADDDFALQVIGTVAGGFLNDAAGWRWIFWVILIFVSVWKYRKHPRTPLLTPTKQQGGVTAGLGLLFMRETYSPVLLARKARRLRKTTGDERYRSQHDMHQQPVLTLLRVAIVSPMRMLFTSGILFVLSANVSIVYGYLYLVFTTLTYAYKFQYGFSSSISGLIFLGIGVGMFIGMWPQENKLLRGVIITSPLTTFIHHPSGSISVGMALDKIAAHRQRTRPLQPEDRLPPLVPGAIFIPVGLFWYGWALQAHAFWLVPLLGMGVFGAGIIATFVPIQMYLIDAFPEHVTSALAGLAMMRSVVGAILPLAGGQMYDTLGYGWGNSLLGFVALVLTPIPLLLMRYGKRMRTGRAKQEENQETEA
jgi:MFS family permease